MQVHKKHFYDLVKMQIKRIGVSEATNETAVPEGRQAE